MDSDRKVIRTVSKLLALAREGERGFKVAAESVPNRGLKILLKSYAAQRAEMAATLQAEVERLGGSSGRPARPGASLHRGWIYIKAGMAIGPRDTENVVLDEIGRGEALVKRAYDQALGENVPAPTRSILEVQRSQLRDVGERIAYLRGQPDSRLVVRLADRPEVAQRMCEELEQAGFDRSSIEVSPVEEVIDIYQDERPKSSLRESAGTGGLMGLLLGGLIGLLAGSAAWFGVAGSGLEALSMAASIAVLTAIGVGIGAFFGALLGAFLGLDVLEEDRYLYSNSLARGRMLVLVQAPAAQTSRAREIMTRINAAERGERVSLPAAIS